MLLSKVFYNEGRIQSERLRVKILAQRHQQGQHVAAGISSPVAQCLNK